MPKKSLNNTMNIIIIVLILLVLLIPMVLFVKRVVSFHDNYKKLIKIIFPIIILSFGIGLISIILNPIKKEKEKNYRYEFIKSKMIDIRSAELAFKEKHNQFTDDFNVLIPVSYTHLTLPTICSV